MRWIGIIGGLALAVQLPAEVLCALGPGAASYRPSQDERPSADVMELAKRVNSAFAFVCSPKCPEIAVFRNTTAANAMLVLKNDQAKVIYAPQFFRDIYNAAGDGAILAVIAHEYGHALAESYPAQWMKNSWSVELRADAWAGCALAKSGIAERSTNQALLVVSKYPPAAISQVSWSARLPAFRLGYTHCGGVWRRP